MTTNNFGMPSLFPQDSVPPSVVSMPASWDLIKSKLRESIDPNDFNTWIEPLNAREEHGSIIITLPNLVYFQGVQNEFAAKIEAARSALGMRSTPVRYELAGQPAAGVAVPDLAPPRPNVPVVPEKPEFFTESTGDFEILQMTQDEVPAQVIAAPESAAAFSRSISSEGPNLDPNYTFDSFVRGESNQFAVATCMSAAENLGKSYNPLFIYGSSGLGKTHLLHAVGNYVLKQNPSAVVTYIPSERFMNEMIYCLRFNKMFDFRQKFRNCDVILVDDIQFISNKKATQEEFFHTFNSLYAARKQIVITSDMFPKDIPDIEDRLRNRFQWGLIADIQAPSIEHRMAILYSKAEKLGIRLSDEVAEYIARHVKRNIRELEGALHRIHAFSALHGESITLDLAMQTFKDVLGDAPKRVTIETVQKVVAEHFKLRVSDLKSKRKQKNIAYPRQIAMYLCRKLISASYPEIGEKFGGRDHTTIIHGNRKIEADLQRDIDVRTNVHTLERVLEQLQ